MSCGNELTACENDMDCACVLDCVGMGGNFGQCKNMCGAQGNMALEALLDCADANCGGC
jgi:hypothetical protein